MSSVPSGSGFARAVADFALGVQGSDVPMRDTEASERSILDTVGVMLAGCASPQGRLVGTFVHSFGGPGPFTAVGSARTVDAPMAALANGTFAHCDDFDDMGGYGHPSAPIVGALLPAVELLQRETGVPVTGVELTLAHVVGFEFGAAFCSRTAYNQYERCFHSTPVFGALAAVISVSRLLRLSRDQTVTALSLAASSASGLGRSSGSMVKPLHAGLASRNALVSALAARNGATADPGIFEAHGGFLSAYFGHRAVDTEGVAAALGEPFRVADTATIKRFPCCGSNHSAISGMLALLERNPGLDVLEIDEVVVHGMMETSPVTRFPRPSTGCSAKFSIEYVLGLLLTKGSLELSDFRDEAVDRPDVVAAAALVRPEVSGRWDVGRAAKHKGNAVSVRLRDGRVLTEHVLRTDLIGGPKNPVSLSWLQEKFHRNATMTLPEVAATRAGQAWSALRDASDVAPLVALLRAAPKSQLPPDVEEVSS